MCRECDMLVISLRFILPNGVCYHKFTNYILYLESSLLFTIYLNKYRYDENL